MPAGALVLLGLNEPMVVTLSEAKSLGTMGGMLRSAQHDKPLGYFRRAVLEACLGIQVLAAVALPRRSKTAAKPQLQSRL